MCAVWVPRPYWFRIYFQEHRYFYTSFSFLSGNLVYISEHTFQFRIVGAKKLSCISSFCWNVCPQHVRVFYSHNAQTQLPSFQLYPESILHSINLFLWNSVSTWSMEVKTESKRYIITYSGFFPSWSIYTALPKQSLNFAVSHWLRRFTLAMKLLK